MLLSTTFGQNNPCSLQWIYSPEATEVWLVFEPGAFIQGPTGCYAHYEVELIVRDSVQVYGRLLRRLTLLSTSEEVPLQPNILQARWPKLPVGVKWEVVIWDLEQRQAHFRQGHLSAQAWQANFFRVGAGYTTDQLGAEQLWLYRAAPGIYLGQAALYQAESSLPELTRYLSLQEKRFSVRATAGIDTLRLLWQQEDLPPGRYLIGLYLYQGEEPRYQAFYPVRRR